ncbi:uncharacterized protein LOC130512574 isoform X2 [Raphanus sativus]|uniref:Uncharacterized protein LOC130512574 isoform X2 n=1 Tax=Raphanus sativus TaxID=3726 RepID=A0A9W3DSS2_RAPSA|nr:uncharacterized protein LOC130512574 isoform X2 [Raphanus sativus]
MRKSVSLNNLSEYESTEETLKIVGEDGDGQAKNKTSSCYASADDAVPVSANRERKRVPWTEEEHKLFLLGLERVLLPSISLMRSAQVSHCVCYLLCVTCRIKVVADVLYSVLKNNNLLSCRQCRKLKDGRMFKILLLFANDMLVSFLLRSFTCCVLYTQKKTKEEVKSKRAHKEVCNSSSRMSVVYSLIVREEEVLMEQRKRECGGCLRDNIRSIYQ